MLKNCPDPSFFISLKDNLQKRFYIRGTNCAAFVQTPLPFKTQIISLFLIQGSQPIKIKGRGFCQLWNPNTPLSYCSSSVESLFNLHWLELLVYRIDLQPVGVLPRLQLVQHPDYAHQKPYHKPRIQYRINIVYVKVWTPN